MDDEERAFLDGTRAWYGSGEGRDIDAPSYFRSHYSTRLHHAARYGWCSAIRWLLVRGANVEATAQFGFKPLHCAAAEGRRDAAVVLLDAGADLNARTLRQSTSLHLNTDANLLNCKMFKLLLSRGASLDAHDSKGRDPEAYARVLNRSNNAALFADVRAAGGWSAYVAAPRNQLLALRRELPTCFRTAPCRARAQARLFLDRRIPDDVFMHVLTFWRSARDSEY